MFHVHEARKQKADLKLQCATMLRNAGGQDLKGQDLENYNKLFAEMVTVDATIARHEANLPQSDGPSSVINMERGITPDGFTLPIFAKGQSVADHLKKTGAAASFTFGEMLRAMVLGGGSQDVRAALSEGTDSAGGYTVPSILSGNLIDNLRAKSVMFQAGARTVLLETGKPTTIAAITGDAVATWRAENASVSTSDLTFAPVSFTPKSLAVIVLASRELIEDSVNLNEAITTSVTAALSGELDRVALIGSGSGSEPKGVSKVSGVGSVSMGTNGAALTAYDPFIQALGTLQAANAQDPTAVIIAPRTNQEAGLLKDTTGQPLRRPEALNNLPFLVTSKLPITETQGSASTASRAVMGYFPDVLIGMRSQLRIEVLREKYADVMQYGFLCHLRADVAVAHAANFCNVVGIL